MNINHSVLLAAVLLVSTTVNGANTYVADRSAIDNAISQADESAARNIAIQCVACHRVEAQEKGVKFGPSLWGIVGRSIASLDDYDYSVGLLNRDGIWDNYLLDEFLSSPENFAKGTNMALPGISDSVTRAHIIRYLHSLTDKPIKFKNSSTTPIQPTLVDPFGDSWPIGSGRRLTGHTCNVCHSLAIVKQQGQTKDGWLELIDWMVDEQGMSELSSSDRKTISDYLATHFNPQAGKK